MLSHVELDRIKLYYIQFGLFLEFEFIDYILDEDNDYDILLRQLEDPTLYKICAVIHNDIVDLSKYLTQDQIELSKKAWLSDEYGFLTKVGNRAIRSLWKTKNTAQLPA